jgi:RHS repeat-associated protein
VTDSYEYDAFGNSFTKQGATPNNYLYRGEQFDSDLGLYYLRARYYNPNSGRFMSRDPEDGKAKDPKTLHKYLYAGGDPINAVDPTGKGIIEYVWTNVRSAALGVLEGHKYGEIVLCLLQFVNDRMLAVYLGLPFSGVGMPDWDLQACLELAGML